MPKPPDGRSRNRLATRESISDAATRLFMEHGFDRVTVDEVAKAASVGRMTVFNHFPRKEDLFFDRDEEIRSTIRETLSRQDLGISPIEALRLLAHRLIAEDSPYLHFSAGSQIFIQTIEGSETLKARARAIRDEIASFIAELLSKNNSADPIPQLAANLLLATWTVAYVRAHRKFQQTEDAAQAKAVFLALIDRGSVGLKAALAGTPYS